MTWQPPDWAKTQPTPKAAPVVNTPTAAPSDDEIAPGWGKYSDWKERTIELPDGRTFRVAWRMTEREIPTKRELIESFLEDEKVFGQEAANSNAK